MFRPSHPVTQDAFFNRDRELERLVDHVERLQAGAPSWVALLGLRKVGKTSLLLELARRVSSDRLNFVLIDSHEFGIVDTDIVRRYAVRVADAVLGPESGRSLEATVHRAGRGHRRGHRRRLSPLRPGLRPLAQVALAGRFCRTDERPG